MRKKAKPIDNKVHVYRVTANILKTKTVDYVLVRQGKVLAGRYSNGFQKVLEQQQAECIASFRSPAMAWEYLKRLHMLVQHQIPTDYRRSARVTTRDETLNGYAKRRSLTHRLIIGADTFELDAWQEYNEKITEWLEQVREQVMVGVVQDRFSLAA